MNVGQKYFPAISPFDIPSFDQGQTAPSMAFAVFPPRELEDRPSYHYHIRNQVLFSILCSLFGAQKFILSTNSKSGAINAPLPNRVTNQ